VTTASHCAGAVAGRPGEPSAGVEPFAQRLGLHEERERRLAVDLDDGDRRPVRILQARVAADVDALEVAGADPLDDLERGVAELTPLRDVDDDPRDRDPA
jgi:hypothetical protein